jgi:hypothetical protein
MVGGRSLAAAWCARETIRPLFSLRDEKIRPNGTDFFTVLAVCSLADHDNHSYLYGRIVTRGGECRTVGFEIACYHGTVMNVWRTHEAADFALRVRSQLAENVIRLRPLTETD